MSAPHTDSAPDLHSSSEEYARRFAGPVGAWMLSVQEQCVLDALAGQGIDTILDVGGGHAQLAGPLSANGHSVTVVGSVDDVPERISSVVRDGRVQYSATPLDRLGYADRAFDAVVSVRIVSHAPDWRRQIGELCRVARRLVVIDYAPRRSLNVLAPILFHLKKGLEGNTRKYLVVGDRQVEEAFAEAGFRLHFRRRQFAVPMGLHRALRCPGVSRRLESLLSACGVTGLIGSPVIAGYVRDE